jgi:transcription elongation GreA/GreB family factor
MFERLEKYREELARAKARRADLDAKIKELERKCKEEENAQIHGMVHAMNMTPEQLQQLLARAASGKLFEDEKKDISIEEPKEDETDDFDEELMEELNDEDKD